MATQYHSTKRTQLLVSGYVRSIELTLTNNLNKIIPDSITLICLSYYNATKYMLYVSDQAVQNPHQIYITTINDDINSNKYQCNIKELDKIGTYQTSQKMWTLIYVGLCYHPNISIPTMIHQQICKQNNSNNLTNDYNIVFKCCGNSNGFSSDCSAILINTEEFSQTNCNPKISKNIDINAYNLDLPQYPISIDYNVCIYSSKYNALYGIGGWQKNNFYKLSFNHSNIESLNKWKWKELPFMHSMRAYPAISFIDDALIVIGGFINNESSTVELYDFNTKKWKFIKSTNISAYTAGCCYDKYNKYVYLGGGYQRPNDKKSEYLDLNKEKWISLPLTTFQHYEQPVLWTEDVNKLYIASPSAKMIESIDIRESNDRWTTEKQKYDFGTPVIGSCKLLI